MEVGWLFEMEVMGRRRVPSSPAVVFMMLSVLALGLSKVDMVL